MKILGITDGHNSTACLMIDGEIVACASEERFSRLKVDVGYPRQSIDYCLSHAKISPDQLDVIALSGFDDNLAWRMFKREATFGVADYVFEEENYFKPIFLDKKSPGEVLEPYIKKVLARKGPIKTEYDFKGVPIKDLQNPEVCMNLRKKAVINHLGVDPKKIKFIEHHDAHGYFAYYNSPIREDCLIVTVDGCGDKGINATLATVKDGAIKRIFSTTNCQIGRMYRYATLLLGMKPFDHEYKVMGLAPYSNEKELKRAYAVYGNVLKVNGLEFEYKEKPTDLYFYFKEKLEGCRFDGIAAAIQKVTEETVTEWVKNAVKKTGLRKIVFSGGVAMNIKLTQSIIKLPEVETVFVGPSPADESNAVGACYVAMHEYCVEHKVDPRTIKPLTDIYLGPEFGDKEVDAAIKKHDAKKKYKVLTGVDDKFVAEQLKKGMTVARCIGRMEFGARALGNRSILANPSDDAIVRKINTQIKFRDFWMPFTPTILFERCKDYIINPKNIYSPYMTIAFDSTELAQKELIAALHPADLTARPQMLKKDSNPGYYNVLKEFEKLTGIGGVLNTSFNLHGEPVVCSPEDAFHTFENSKLDMLYFGNIAVARK